MPAPTPANSAAPRSGAVAGGLSALVRRVAPALLGTALLGWFFRGFDYAGFRTALAQFSPGALVLLSGVILAATVLQGLCFWILLPAGLSPLRHIGMCFAMYSGNILLPLRSGELLRPFYLRCFRPELTLRTLLLWSVVDRALLILTGLPLLLAGAAVFMADADLWPVLRRSSAILGAVAVIAALAGAVLLARYMKRQGAELAGRGVLRRVGLATAIYVPYWVTIYLMYYIVLPEPRLALALTVVVSCATAIPSLPANLGSYEAAFLWVGSLWHVPHDTVLAAALLSHAAQILLTLAVGGPLILLWGWPRRDAASGAVAVPGPASPMAPPAV